MQSTATAIPRLPESSAESIRKADPSLVSQRFLNAIPRDFAREHLILSQGAAEDGETELIATAESTAEAAIFNVCVHMGVAVRTLLCEAESIAIAIDEAYGRFQGGQNSTVDAPVAGAGEDIDEMLARADRDLLSTQGKGPIVKLVDAILFEALSRGASDVHVQPLADRTLIRYRLDGVLHTVREIGMHSDDSTDAPSHSGPVEAKRLTAAIVSRIKVMGRMDIAERRLPQDGRAAVNIGSSESGGRAIDLRISTLPTSYGERAVIRLLDNTNHLCDFESIGMPPAIAERYIERTQRANGMILLTGPTGSGKTTTLYSTLRQIASTSTGLNIMTIEDPIEYELATAGLAVSQAQVNPRKGVTFATGLRHILRQDPDVVMVGEIRDAETARIAIQSSLTGHMVFSTLHTNDAPSAVTRLIDLGVEPYLVSASLSAVLAQRLVRTLHAPCAGKGCDACFGTGYLGRTGLFELMSINEGIAELIARNAVVAELRAAAQSSGMKTLAEDGARLVQLGRTTRQEVQRVVQSSWSGEAGALP